MSDICHNITMSKKDILHDTLLNRKELIEHAKAVLGSDWTGVDIAKELEMNSRQVYAYRKGRRNIENATYDTLLKFESVYQEYYDLNTKKLGRREDKTS